MPRFVRLVRVLRTGPPRRRLQAWLGLALLAGSAIWIVWNLWELLVTVALFLAAVVGGLYLLGRSMRDSPPYS